jgi:hypothetical protein
VQVFGEAARQVEKQAEAAHAHDFATAIWIG